MFSHKKPGRFSVWGSVGRKAQFVWAVMWIASVQLEFSFPPVCDHRDSGRSYTRTKSWTERLLKTESTFSTNPDETLWLYVLLQVSTLTSETFKSYLYPNIMEIARRASLLFVLTKGFIIMGVIIIYCTVGFVVGPSHLDSWRLTDLRFYVLTAVILNNSL